MDVTRVSAVKSSNQASDNGTDTPIELTNITGTYLNHLNEDCLLQIFSSVTPVDLCSLAGTCERFEQITQRVFPKEMGIKFDRDEYTLSSNDYTHYIEPANVEHLLKSFGNCLSKLSVHHWDKCVLDLIANNYDAIMLKHLDIRTNFQQSQDSLMHCWDSIYPSITGQLVELDVNISISAWVASSISKHTFPNLERFTFRRNDNGVQMNASHAISNEIFLKFFDCHTRLRTLEFTEDRILFPSPQRKNTNYRERTIFCCHLTIFPSFNLVTHSFVKTSTELGKLTLPNEPPYKIVMRSAPINEV